MNIKPIRKSIFRRIVEERDRQDKRFGWLGEPGSRLPSPDHDKRLTVLVEEIGEVARAVIERDAIEHLHEELIQLAACCVAWIEADETRKHKYTWRTVPIGYDVAGSGVVVEKSKETPHGNIYITFARHEPFVETWVRGVRAEDHVPIAICSHGLVYE